MAEKSIPQAVPTKRWFLAFNSITELFWTGQRFDGDGPGSAQPVPDHAMPILRLAWQNVSSIPCVLENAS